jgi:hypothetical protein
MSTDKPVVARDLGTLGGGRHFAFEANDPVGIIDDTTVSTRHYITLQHLWSAQHSARLCAEREADLVARNASNVDIEHRSLAIGAVMSAVAFLQAFVNQVYADAAESPPGAVRPEIAGLTVPTAAALRQSWITKTTPSVKPKVANVLRYYQHAPHCAGASKLAADRQPYRGVKVLIDLRNALVHFVPETQEHGLTHKFEQNLARLITENEQPIGQPWYPNKALGAGCAAWAWTVATDFADQWRARMGLIPDYRAVLAGFPAP